MEADAREGRGGAGVPLAGPGNAAGTVIAGPHTVTVLVGAPASGKTTLRTRLLADAPGLPVVSLDDERAALRREDLLAGRELRPLQSYSHRAVQRCAAAACALLAAGRGYLADATNLRRRERVAQVAAAHAAGLRAVAVLLPDLPVEALAERDAGRAELARVPLAVLAKHAHRRSLLSADLLRTEGFDLVVEQQLEPIPGSPADALAEHVVPVPE